MRNRISLNAIAVTGREKKPAGIDFDIVPAKKREKKVKEEQPELFEQVYSDAHYDEYRKNKDKNLFEEVIEKMMLESCYDETFQPYIDDIREIIAKKIPAAKKRFAILCVLDKNRNLMRKAKIYQDGNISMGEHVKDYVQILRKYVRVSEIEKKKFGEVMTPIELVTEMLNKLPREVWSNPNLKWLDPCNGVGPFGALVVAGLMKGLKSWEPDDNKRYEHIMQNMVYVCELQPKNMFLWLALMDPQDRYNMNVYCGSFLDAGFDKHMKAVWGIEKFDVIVGNPPYNGEQETKGDKRGGGFSLWDKFVVKSLDILNKDKYLSFVHPSMWRKPESKNSKNKGLFEIFTTYQIEYLEIHDSRDGLRVFNAGTRYDWYVIKKSPYSHPTIIIDENGDKNLIDIREWNFLPNKNFELIKKLLSNGEDKCNLIWNTYYHTATGRYDYVSSVQTDTHIYPLVHSTNKNGNRFFYTSQKNDHFGVCKCIFGESGINSVIADIEGEYGMTQGAMAIAVERENIFSLKNVLESNSFKEVLEATSWGNFRIDWRLFTYFKKDFWKEFIN